MNGGVPKQRRRRLDPTQRYSLRVVLFAVAVVLIAAPFAALLLQVVFEGPVTRLDLDVAEAANGYVHDRPGLAAILRALTRLGGTAWLAALTAATSIAVVRRGRRRLAAFVIVTAVGGALVNTAVKLAVARPRPDVEHVIATAGGKSFPSGHAMFSTVVYGAVLLVLLPALRRRGARRAAVAATALLVLAIGATRVLLGVHYLSDVLGGTALGLAWLSASVAAFEIWRTDRGQPRSDPLDEGLEPEAGDALRGEFATGSHRKGNNRDSDPADDPAAPG